MRIQTKIGAPAPGANNGDHDLRSGRLGDLIVSGLHPEYFERTLQGAGFSAANQAGATTSVAFATTYLGLVLSNPIGSPVNLVLDKVGFCTTVAFAAAASIGIMTGKHDTTNLVHTTPVTPKCGLVGGPVGYGLVDAAATLPVAPTLAHILSAGLTGAITVQTTQGLQMVDLDGSIILPPGAFAAFYTSTASGASGFWGSMAWSEVLRAS